MKESGRSGPQTSTVRSGGSNTAKSEAREVSGSGRDGGVITPVITDGAHKVRQFGSVHTMTTRALPDQRAATGEPLLVTLAGVAELAQVSRPVASMWRKRFAAADDPFPASIARVNGADAFDASEVADWLSRTAHGKNPDAKMDAAAAAVPAGFSFSDPQAVGELEALIALHAQRGALDSCTAEDLRNTAAHADPDDTQLRSEVESHADRGAHWLGYVGRLVDAAYSASAALALVGRRHAASRGSAGSAGRLSPDAVTLIGDATRALAHFETAIILDPHDAEVSSALAIALGDEAHVTIPAEPAARQLRRRLRAEGVWLADAADGAASRSVTVARVPAGRSDDIATMLRAVDDVSLGLSDDDAAVIIGPARALVDALSSSDERLRADVLRTGRVRGIARLTPGLVDTAPREALALWVLGAPMGQVAIADRFTVVADLTDVPLTPATRADLVSDIVASMGSAREVRAHSFRFAIFARTAALLARGGALVESSITSQGTHPKAADLPALIDAAAGTVQADIAPIVTAPASHATPASATVAHLMHDGHVRMISGTRLDPDLLGAEGLVVVTASDLESPASIGSTRVNQLAFATQHPTAQLTRPGDVIFRTAPTAAAWVDTDGSKVVAYPARVLRITVGDPGGLVPEIIAADITGAVAGPGAWKRWILRRVAPHAIAPLRHALAGITAARADLEARAALLDDYAALIVAGATSGEVTLIDTTTAADAASTQ